MAKVTSKLQVTIPKVLADHYGIHPGDEIGWEPAGEVIRVIPPGRKSRLDTAERLRLFDQASARQRAREAEQPPHDEARDRGWAREDLYVRGRAD